MHKNSDVIGMQVGCIVTYTLIFSNFRLLDELKAKYERDKSNLTSQVQELQSQKPHLEVQLLNVTTENKRLQVQVKTLNKLLKCVPCVIYYL